MEGQGYSHPQICESSHHWIINLSDPCILTVGEECANDEDVLRRSVDLAHMHKNTLTVLLPYTWKKQILPSPTCMLHHKGRRLGLQSLLLLWPNFHLDT